MAKVDVLKRAGVEPSQELIDALTADPSPSPASKAIDFTRSLMKQVRASRLEKARAAAKTTGAETDPVTGELFSEQEARAAREKKAVDEVAAVQEEAEERTTIADAIDLPAGPSAALTAPQPTGVRAGVSGAIGPGPTLRVARRRIREIQGQLSGSQLNEFIAATEKDLTALAEKHQDQESQFRGTLDTLAEVEFNQEQLAQRQEEAMNEWKGKLAALDLEARYPGIQGGMARIQQLQEVIEDQRREPTVEGATAAIAAQQELDRAQEPDQGRLLGPVENQIMAAIAIGFGALGSALSGLPNHGLNMVNAAIEKDIAAQRDRFQRKGETYARNRNLYELAQRQYENEWQRTAALRNYYLNKSATVAQQMGATRAQQQILAAAKRDAFNVEARLRDQQATLIGQAMNAETQLAKFNADLEIRRNAASVGPKIPPGILQPIEHSLNALHATMRLEKQFWDLTKIVTGGFGFIPGAERVYKKQVQIHGFKIARSEQSNRITEKDREVAVDIVPDVWTTRFTAWRQFNNMYGDVVNNLKNKIQSAEAGGHDMTQMRAYTNASIDYAKRVMALGDNFDQRKQFLGRRDEEMQRGAGAQWEARQRFLQQLHELGQASQAQGQTPDEINEAKARARGKVIE
jgi:hypothetical protein